MKTCFKGEKGIALSAQQELKTGTCQDSGRNTRASVFLGTCMSHLDTKRSNAQSCYFGQHWQSLQEKKKHLEYQSLFHRRSFMCVSVCLRVPPQYNMCILTDLVCVCVLYMYCMRLCVCDRFKSECTCTHLCIFFGMRNNHFLLQQKKLKPTPEKGNRTLEDMHRELKI